MEKWILGLILVSALALITYLHWRKNRHGKTSSFNPPPYDYSDRSEDGLGANVFPPPAPRRRGEKGMFDGLPDDGDNLSKVGEFPDFLKKGFRGPLPENHIVRPRRVSPDDRRPASEGDRLLNTLLYGTATKVPMPRDEVRAEVREVRHEEGAQNLKHDRRDGDGNHRAVSNRDDVPEPSRAADDGDQPRFSGGSSPDLGGSSGGDSGGRRDGGE